MKILFIAPLPPPVHGSSMVSKYIKESALIQESFDCDFVNLSTSRSMDEIGKGGLKKIFRFLGSLLTLLSKLLTHRYDLCYIAITCHGMGFLKDAPFALLCKLFGHKLLLHQHNKGMSRDCNRWPYRWLMPLVYRNATVMLLSWHLYEDISAVVKREQVIICPNGIPEPHPNPLQGERGLGLRDETSNLTQNSQKAQNFSINTNVDANSQNARIASLACAHPDEDTQSVYDNVNENENCHPDGTVPSSRGTSEAEGVYSKHYTLNSKQNQPLAELENQQSETAINQRPEGAINRAEHFNRSAASLTGTEGAKPRLLFLSNLIVSKGIYVLLEACQRLKERGVAFHCDYVGGESKEVTGEQFRKAIAERGLEDCVTYHGPQYGADKDRAFRRADIFVQPTFDDCFPLTLVEAMQYKLPIVSTDVGAIPDIVTDGVNGLVCKQQDVDSLVVALSTLLADPAMRQEMGERGHARYLKEMTLEGFERSFAELLKSVVCRV